MFSKDHVYTHTSLLFAYQMKEYENMNVNMELLQDEKPNCYLYGKYKADGIIQGSSIFNKWNDRLMAKKISFPKIN